jgi:hypothetical protein
MASVRYISDNPYRLLAVGSSVSRRELGRKAQTAESAARVGLGPEAGLRQVFGGDEMPHCAGVVHSLATDHKRLTIYRLFWPFHFEEAPGGNGTLADIDRLLTGGSGEDSFSDTQLRFLRAWLDFESGSQCLPLALNAFADLYCNEECDEYLGRLLQTEGVREEDAPRIVEEAQDEIIEHLLTSACQRAAHLWEKGDLAASLALVEAVCDSRFGADRIDRALERISSLGDREMARVRSLIDEFYEWSPGQVLHDADTVDGLLRLAQAVKGRLSTAALWIETVEARGGQVAWSMREYAVELANNTSDHEAAKTILLQAHALPAPAKVTEAIDQDLSELAQLIERKAQFQGIRPVDGAPTLSTFNGLGFAMYGRAPFAARAGWYLATYFFVILFIPVIPLARYLVSDAPGGGWYFHGQVPLTKGNKLYVCALLATVLIGLMMLHTLVEVDSAPPPALASTAKSESAPKKAAAKSPLTRKATKPMKVAQAPTEAALARPVEPDFWMQVQAQEVSQRSRLQAERERLVGKLNAQGLELAGRDLAIEQARVDLEQERIAIEPRRQKLEVEKGMVDQASDALSLESYTIDKARQELTAAKARIALDRSQLDHTSEEAVSAFNEQVQQYNSDQTEFDRQIDQYNGNLQEYRQKLDRYRAIKNEFNRSVSQYNSRKKRFNHRVEAYNERVRARRRARERLQQIEQALGE